MSSSLFGHRLECCLTQLQIATGFPISVHPAPCCRHSDASSPPRMQEQYLNTHRQHLSQHQLCDPWCTADPAAIRAAVMAVWAIKPGCFLWPTADVTGGGFNGMVPWQDHWKLVGLVLRQIIYRVVAKFLRYRWHPIVEEPQRCAGICMMSPLDRELRLLSHVKHSPRFHGMIVAPSGRFPSFLDRPRGSFCAGILALPNDLQTTSLIML